MKKYPMKEHFSGEGRHRKMAVVWPESPQTCIHTPETMDTHHLTQCLCMYRAQRKGDDGGRGRCGLSLSRGEEEHKVSAESHP